MTQDSVLVIGKPNSGKSGFFGQLYTRLKLNQIASVDLYQTPPDLTALNKITSRYAEGKALEHTPSSEYSEIKLPIKTGEKNYVLEYPDYGGEQVNELIDKRRVNDVWYKSINKSDNWLLFIRLNDLDRLNNPTEKFAEIVHTGDQRRKENLEDSKIPSPQAFFIELLQMFLYYKGKGFLKKNELPSLTIIMSCWDELNDVDGVKPGKLFKEELPLLNDFVQNNWKSYSYNIVGLSSQGRTLDKEEPNFNYQDYQEGYIVKPNGKKTQDLTYLLKYIID